MGARRAEARLVDQPGTVNIGVAVLYIVWRSSEFY